MPAPKRRGGDEQQAERDQRQQQPVHAAEPYTYDPRLRRGAQAQVAVEQPADREAGCHDDELEPARRRRERGLDPAEVDGIEHGESLPEFVSRPVSVRMQGEAWSVVRVPVRGRRRRAARKLRGPPSIGHDFDALARALAPRHNIRVSTAA